MDFSQFSISFTNDHTSVTTTYIKDNIVIETFMIKDITIEIYLN